MRRLCLGVATVLAGSLLLASCGGSAEEQPSPESQETAPGSTLSASWPLTGLPVTGDDSAAQEHPVFVVKVDNTASSAPQLGLGTADLVVEELVEGGLTRLAVFFYSEFPDVVGPVRSMRASDIGIVKPDAAQMVTSGAAAVTIGRLEKAGVEFHGEGSPGIFRDSGRSGVYSVMARLPELAEEVKVEEARPADYLPWGDEKSFPRGRKATTITASFGGHTTNWKFAGGRYVNTNSYAAKGDEFAPDTVLVLRVKVGDAGYRDPAGNPVPETKFEGKGEALIFRDGRVVRAQWSKEDIAAPLALSTKAGELRMPPGKVWIELVPAANGDVSFQ